MMSIFTFTIRTKFLSILIKTMQGNLKIMFCHITIVVLKLQGIITWMAMFPKFGLVSSVIFNQTKNYRTIKKMKPKEIV